MNVKQEMIKEIMTALPEGELENLCKLDLDDLAKCYVAVVSTKMEKSQ
jgi:hypothetical protein